MPDSFVYRKNLLKRVLATLLDYSLFFLVVLIYVEIFGEDDPEGGKVVTNLFVLPIPFFWFFYFVATEAFSGATLGHQAFNLRVVTFSRKDISFTAAIKRRLTDGIDFLGFGLPALILLNKTEKCQRLGDIWAETIVVDTKDPEQYPLPYKQAIKL